MNTCEQCGTQTAGEDICLSCIVANEMVWEYGGL